VDESEFVRLAELAPRETDRRDGGKLSAAVSAYVSQQSGETVNLAAGED